MSNLYHFPVYIVLSVGCSVGLGRPVDTLEVCTVRLDRLPGVHANSDRGLHATLYNTDSMVGQN